MKPKSTRHCSHIFQLYTWILMASSLFGLSNQASALTPATDCSTVTNAQFLAPSGLLCLPVIEVPGDTGIQFYKAQLKLSVVNASTHFVLESAEPIAAAVGTHNPTFSLASGVLTIPVVEWQEIYGINRYSATLKLSSSDTFTLTTIAAIIPANYREGITWKPYVGLLPNEKNAINLLQRAQPYTPLAEAIYDFGIKQVGDWQLIDQRSTGSGMQGGVYRNVRSNELVIAFRGTELCLIPISCSFSQINESSQDAWTDTLLTQGHDSGQFHDAFIYTSDVLKANPNSKITVIGHSLGGGLAQSSGASFLLETYAFNSSPVPNNFWNDHGINQFDSRYTGLISVLADIHDPVSSTNASGAFYADAVSVTPNIKFDFDNKVIMPTYKTSLDSLRFNKHSITKLKENMLAVTLIYQDGW